MRHYLLLSFLFTIFQMSNGQELTIKSENKQKTFPSLHALTIYATTNKTKLDYFRYLGQIVRVENDSITLKLKNLKHEILTDDDKIIMHNHHFTNSPELPEFMTIAKHDIYGIGNFNNPKKAKRRKVRKSLAGFLLSAGLVTFASSYVVNDKSDRKGLQLLSAIEFGGGIILGLTSKEPYYDTWNEWQIK